jgi:hypothetical protein
MTTPPESRIYYREKMDMSLLQTPDPLIDPSLSTVPSPDEKHQGLLGDYDSLLSLLRNTQPEVLANTLVKPKRCSPMYLEDEAGQRSLQALAQHEDYRTQCTRMGAPYYPLTVTLIDGKAVYETLARDSQVTVAIPLGKNPVWDLWLPNIEKAARKLGAKFAKAARLHSQEWPGITAYPSGIRLMKNNAKT